MIGSLPSSPAASPEETPLSTGSSALRRVRLRSLLMPLLALFTAFVFCGILLLITGHNPLYVYQVLWTGAVTGPSSFPETLVSTTPYILLGLAVAVGFKGGVFNIGAEGQFILGAIGATWAGHLFPTLPAIVLAPFALLVGVRSRRVFRGRGRRTQGLSRRS